ncbi:MAG: helix-hairpin-helix domain-containing protein [Ruminococcus sp.]|nr:helix-hairpin-helix domain-containing protein [Ruminococcus sp.]
MKTKDTLLTALAALIFFSSAVGAFVIERHDRKHRDPIVIEKLEGSDTTEPVSTEAEPAPTEPLLLELNLATAEELQLLPGIGQSLAQRIVDYRASVGQFRNIEELMDVNGIGQGIFDGLRSYIYVTDPVYEEPTTLPPTEPPTEEPPPDPEPIYEEEEIPYEEPEEEPELTIEDIAPIDLNTAEQWQLELLPYVTEDIAQSILSLREAIHGFSHCYELLYVEELEQDQVAEIIGYVTVCPQE